MASDTSGIILTSGGRYLEARLICGRTRVPVARYIRWGRHDWLRLAALLHRGALAGIPSCWQHSSHARFPQGYLQAPDQSAFVVAALQAQVDDHCATLRNNCLGVAPDDAYLATLPAVFCTAAPESFVSAHLVQEQWNIGVIINRRLIAVFHLAPAQVESLEGHLGRIERYLALRDAGLQMPHVVFSFGGLQLPAIDAFDIRQVEIPGAASEDHLKALGLACLKASGISVPFLAGPTGESRLRGARTGLLAVTAIMIGLIGLAGLCCMAMNWRYGQRLSRYAADYRRVVAENREIRALLDESEVLADRINRLRRAMERRPAWTELLNALARERPQGLYFERIGSSPFSAGRVQVAMAGWAEQERSVTDLISRMQKKNLLSDVELKVMEREGNGNGLIRFKMQCMLKLSDE